MDGGQFRVPQRTSRGTVSRPEPSRRPAEKPQPVAEKPVEEAPVSRSAHAPRTTKRDTPPQSNGGSFGLRAKLIVAGIVIAIIAGLGWLIWTLQPGAMAPGIDSSKYQAVFLVNGDIYFGKLESAGKNHMKLTKIYYIQSPTSDTADEESQQPATDQSNVQLIKLGEEIYGPEDAMIISRDQIMLYENLKPNGKVSQAIDSYDKN